MEEQKNYVEEANDTSIEVTESNSENSNGALLRAGLVGAGAVIVTKFLYKHALKPASSWVVKHLLKKKDSKDKIEAEVIDETETE